MKKIRWFTYRLIWEPTLLAAKHRVGKASEARIAKCGPLLMPG